MCPSSSLLCMLYYSEPPPLSMGEMTTPPEPAGNEMDTDDPEQEQLTVGWPKYEECGGVRVCGVCVL